jgi:hypothetical protein
VNRSVARAYAFTAIGYDADGRSTNVTQDVAWSSSDIGVVTAPNFEGNRSRVLAAGFGSATVVATDPASGVTSNDSDESATFVVDSYMTRLRLTTARNVVTVGETIQLTALADLSNGEEANVTQEVEYTSTTPVVALAENAAGDRSRIRALKAGSAFISAEHVGANLTTQPQHRVQLIVVDP